MLIKVLTQDLKRALKFMKAVIRYPGNTVPILNTIKIQVIPSSSTDDGGDNIMLSNTDLETSITTSVAINDMVSNKELDPIIVDKDPFINFILACKAEYVNMEGDDLSDELEIIYGSVVHTIEIDRKKLEQFPKIPGINMGKKIAEIDTTLFNKMVNSVSFAVSREINRPIFFHICWLMNNEGDRNSMTATDGRIIANYSTHKNISRDREILLPGRLAKRIVEMPGKPKTIEIFEEDIKIRINLGNTNIFIFRLVGTYPSWEKVIPKAKCNKYEVNCMDMLEAIRILKYTAGRSPSKKFLMEIDGFHLECRSECRYDPTISTTYRLGVIILEGELELKMAFNLYYLESILRRIDTQYVIFRTFGTMEPVLIDEDDTESKKFYLLMPLRPE